MTITLPQSKSSVVENTETTGFILIDEANSLAFISGVIRGGFGGKLAIIPSHVKVEILEYNVSALHSTKFEVIFKRIAKLNSNINEGHFRMLHPEITFNNF